MVFGVNRYRNAQTLSKAIRRLRFPRGSTHTGRALNLVKSRMFIRSGRKKVVIVITDGRAGDDVSVPSRQLRLMGVEVFAIGVGRRVSQKELRSIATDTGHMYIVKSKALRTIVGSIKRTACKSKLHWSSMNLLFFLHRLDYPKFTKRFNTR